MSKIKYSKITNPCSQHYHLPAPSLTQNINPNISSVHSIACQQSENQRMIDKQSKRIDELEHQVCKLKEALKLSRRQSRKLSRKKSQAKKSLGQPGMYDSFQQIKDVPMIRSRQVTNNSQHQWTEQDYSVMDSVTKRMHSCHSSSIAPKPYRHRKKKRNECERSLIETIVQRKANIQKQLKSRIADHLGTAQPQPFRYTSYVTQ